MNGEVYYWDSSTITPSKYFEKVRTESTEVADLIYKMRGRHKYDGLFKKQ
jgi:hypothetical protein